MKTGENRWKELNTTSEWIFHQLAAKNLNVNAVQWSIASVIQYSIGKKKIIVFIIWPAKIGVLVSGLTNIWPVIMTGDLLSVILSPGNEQKGVLIARIPFLSPQSPPFSPYLPIPKPVRAKHRTDHWNRSRTRKTNNITVKFYGQPHQYLCLLLLSCSL